MITCSVLNLRYEGTVYWVMRTACFQLWFCEIKCAFKTECVVLWGFHRDILEILQVYDRRWMALQRWCVRQ